MIQAAPPETIKRVNGQPPNAGKFFHVTDIEKIRQFGYTRRGRTHFASVDLPEEGKRIRQDVGQMRMSGLVAVPAKSEDLSLMKCKRMRRDPQIALGLAGIKAPIMAAFDTIKVECRDPIIRGFMQQVLMKEGGGILRKAVYSALKSIEFGFIAHEKVWKNGTPIEFQVEGEGTGEPKQHKIQNATILEGVYDLDPEFTEILVDGITGEYKGVRYGADDSQKLPAEKSWLVTHDKEFGGLRGLQAMGRVYSPWYWCDIMYLFCNRYYERKASPPIKGRAPSIVTDDGGNTVAGVDLFTQMLDSLVSDGICVLPSEHQAEGGRFGTPIWDVEFMVDDKRGEMFIKYIEHLQTLKLRGLLIPEMVVERGADSGTYGMAKSHAEFLVDMLTLILEEVLEHVNLYLIPDIVIHNFGPDAPPCSIDTLTKIGDRKDLLEQLVIELIRAESRTGSLDTNRMIDIVSLLRQLDIDVQPRRKLPDYEEQIDQEREQLKIQRESMKQAAAAKVQPVPKEEAAGTPTIVPKQKKTVPKPPGIGSPQASIEDRLSSVEKMVFEIHGKLVGDGSADEV